MKENNKSVTNTIRSKAEEIINNRPNIDSYTNMSEVEIKKLIHDLEVHQIELEMINEELVAQNKAEEIATDKYVELYDFAPSGYFTLSKIGEIIELNLSGAKILGSERLKLKNSHFGSFVSKDSKQDFNLFHENIFHSHSIESCSLSILDNDNPDIRVHVTGIISQNLEQCQITAVDISENWYEHQKLIQSQDKYAKAFLTTTYGVIISRVDDGKLIEINDAFCKITGYSRDEALASTSQSLDLWIDIEDRNKVVKALRETGRFSEMEFRFRKKNGEVIIGAMSSSLVNINNENCILSSINDITERKKAEEKLLESELQYRTLADSGQALIWTATPDKKCDYFNKVWLNFTGRTIEQELGDGWAEGVHPDDLDMCFDIFTTSFDKRVDFSMTYRMRRFDGEYRWILDEGKPRYNMLGEFIGYIGNCLDITNMKESEEKIKQSEEKYRTIIESQSEGIGIVNEKEVFTFANQAACRIFDCEHLEEMSLFDFLTPTETEKINQQTLHRQNGISNNYELQITTQKGNVKYISVSSEPKFNDNSKYEGAYAVFRDVTERKLAQDALTLSEEKYRKDLSLLNSIFESPINIIVFSLDINYCYTAFTKYHSQTMKAIWGVDIQLGMSMLDIISNEDDKGKAKRNFDRVLKDDYFVLTEEYGDDALFRTYYENFYSPVKNNHGEIVGLSVFVIDATARNQATKKLEISEDRFRKVVEQTSDLIAIADSNGFITYASSTSISMFQLSPEEMVGVNFMEFAALDEIDKAKNAFRKILEGGETINDSVFRMKRNGGELFYAELNGSKFETASQNGVLVTIRDITERKRIEENIKAKTSILSNLIINLKEGILLENSSREIELTNQLFCDMFGIPAPPDAMRGADCTESAEQSKMLFKNPDKFVEDIHQILANKVAVFNDELELVDGRYFERDYIPTYLDDVYSGHLWKYRDITEKKNAEIELKKISQAIEQSPFMTVITRVDGTIEYINPSITRITGYSKDDLIGQNPNVLSSGELSQKDYQTLWPTISSGKEWKGEFHNKKKNGEFYWAGALILPIFDVNGKITHYLSIEEDITQRKEIEMQLLELNTNLELKVEERTIQLNEAKKKLENELHERILIEVDLRWNKSLLELMSNSSPLGFLVVDNRTDDILYFNHRFCKIWNIEHIEDQMEQGKFKNNEIIPYCLPVLADVPAFAESCKPLQFEHNRDVIEDEIAFTDNRTVRRFSTQIRGENDEYYGRFYIFEDITNRKQFEAALLESEQRFSLFMDYLPALVFIKDNNSKMIYANNAMEIGLGASEWMNKSLIDVFGSETAERIIEDDNNTIQLGYQLIEESFTNLDGTLHHYETQKFAIPRVGKNPLLGGISLDITERKMAEVLVTQTKQNYETFFNTIDDFLFVLDEQGNIIHVNDTVINRLEYSKEELSEQSVLMVHPAERREEAGRIVGEMLAGSADFCPVPLITKSGIPIPVETKVKTGFWNGKPVIFGVSKDISRIQLSEEKFSKAFHSNSASMAINSYGDGLFIDVNDAFVSTMGYSRNELIGKTSFELNLFENVDDRENIYTILKDNSKISDLEFEVTRRNGEKITGLFSAEQIYVGNNLCILSLFVDITERKKAEEEMRKAQLEAEKANMAKSEFLSRMSHELRTPMNSILGFAQLLEMGDLNTGQKRGVNHIMNSGKHLLDLINQVLDISRIEAGRLLISIEPVRLNAVFEEMMDIINPLAIKNVIDVKLVYSSINQLYVSADRQSFKQILLNLLNNAIKYNKEGGSVEIKTELITNKNTSFIRISITDTGVGIKQEDISKIFIPFERISAYNTQIEGTGLGLSVVKKLVEVMNGSCGVDSEIGNGSTFWFELPQAKNPKEMFDKSVLTKELISELNEKRGTLLYIEDNLSNIELVEQILATKRPHIKLITNMTGKETVNLAIKNKPDLILLDLNLPDIDGSEVLKLILENDKTKTIPVIILSADGMQHQVEKLIMLGAKKYMTKPLEVKEFIRVIDEIICN